jgi:hypothetical protein
MGWNQGHFGQSQKMPSLYSAAQYFAPKEVAAEIEAEAERMIGLGNLEDWWVGD